MKKATAHKVYDVLEDYGASPANRKMFVERHVNQPIGATEWRWQGVLGFGGKFRSHRSPFYVDCYMEDETPERLQAIQEINERLKLIFEEKS